MQKVAIIGAGISGLSMAHFLKDSFDVTLYERESQPGGLIKCQRVNGSLFHTCGGHVFNSKRQDVLDWFWNQFQREEEFSKTDRNAVVVMEDEKVVPYPIENHIYLFNENIQKDFINDLVFIAQHEGVIPTNIEEFLKGRFGSTLYQLYFRPYNEKVWRRDLTQVPLSWLEGKLPMPTVAEMIFNNINHVEEKQFVHSTFWYEKMNGSQYIIDKLTGGLDIRCNAVIDKVEKTSDEKWFLLGEVYDKVVFCGNIKEMVKLVDGVDLAKYAEEVARLEYHGTTAVFCEIDRNPYSWIYQPSRLHQSHRIICTGNFATSNNAAAISNDRMTATIEFTDEISKEDILKQLELIPYHPTYITHQYNPYTYPIQDSHTREMIQNLKTTMAPEGFFFTGRFADWEYYNMDVAIGASMDLAKKIGSSDISSDKIIKSVKK